MSSEASSNCCGYNNNDSHSACDHRSCDDEDNVMVSITEDRREDERRSDEMQRPRSGLVFVYVHTCITNSQEVILLWKKLLLIVCRLNIYLTALTHTSSNTPPTTYLQCSLLSISINVCPFRFRRLWTSQTRKKVLAFFFKACGLTTSNHRHFQGARPVFYFVITSQGLQA